MAKKKILIVEDEPQMRILLSDELKTVGYEVHSACDGEEGFQKAEAVKPDLIIADIMMPHTDGNQLMKKLRQSGFGRYIPFIVLTARGKMRDYFEILEVDCFIEKPFESKDLLKKVANTFKNPNIKTLSVDKEGKEQRKNVRILILEENGLMFSRLQKAFEECGYTVKIVTNISECRQQINLFDPMIIIMNYWIDGKSTHQFIETLKGMARVNKIPVIVYDNAVTEIDEEMSYKAGALCFLSDVNELNLLSIVDETLKREAGA